MSGMKVVIGLGNPGERYRNTRHNVGFMVVAQLAELHRIEDPSRFKKNLVTTGKIEGRKVMLAWPQSYMNQSGAAIKELLNYYKLDLSDALVVHDDMELEVGRVRAVVGGGIGGHNGLASIYELLGERFDRLRVGIGRPDKSCFDRDYAGYVLAPFTSLESDVIDRAILLAAQSASEWVQSGLAACQRKANVRVKPPKALKEPMNELGRQELGQEHSNDLD
ncbi:MAG: aminoacyl-tRNA hydrolase [Deltaproteobacteria bacterium]|nr:aminoacyl-tRNA hydrolase [Deltaproteobacteria bacterium]